MNHFLINNWTSGRYCAILHALINVTWRTRTLDRPRRINSKNTRQTCLHEFLTCENRLTIHRNLESLCFVFDPKMFITFRAQLCHRICLIRAKVMDIWPWFCFNSQISRHSCVYWTRGDYRVRCYRLNLAKRGNKYLFVVYKLEL